MQRFLSFAIVASAAVCPAEARIHIFKDVPVNGSHMAAVKTLYVDASLKLAIINVEEFSCVSRDGSGVTAGGVVLVPASVAMNMSEVDMSELVECTPSLEFGSVGANNVLLSRTATCGTMMTQKMVLAFSGTYILCGAICGSPGSSMTFDMKVSGDQFEAHERGWSFLFSIYFMIHVFLLAALAIYRENCGETMGTAAIDEMFIASAFAVLAHGAGFVSCFLLQPIPSVEMVETSLWAATMSSVMVAMITVSGIGCSEPNPHWRVGYWFFFFVVFFASLSEHGMLFEKYGHYPGRASPIAKCWGIAGSFFIFGFICVRLLARSFRSFQHAGLLECVAVFRKVTVVIAVYTGLGVASAASMVYDVPSGEPEFHRVVGGASTQVTQIFGLVFILLTFWRTKFDTEYVACVGRTIGNALPDDAMSIEHDTSSTVEKGENLGVIE